jgi:integrase
VRDVYLACVKAVFSTAAAADLVSENPAQKIIVKVIRKHIDRPKGFTRDEATRIINRSLLHIPEIHFERTPELPQTTAAKQWAPILCAFTGSRITEITQLRKEDVRDVDDILIIRITPAAGSVKTRQYRDVPLHPQLIDLGFLDFVKDAPSGALFYREIENRDAKKGASIMSRRICTWLRKEKIVPEDVAPNHGWRHTFKTTGRELGIDTRILDAIQGHAAQTAGDEYGDVTVLAKKRAIDQFPCFPLTVKVQKHGTVSGIATNQT